MRKIQTPRSSEMVERKTHELKLKPIYFDMIKSGEKTLEGRLNDEKRKAFQIGDFITFYKEPEKIEKISSVILDKFLFKTFDEMAQKINKRDLGFESKTKEEIVETYRTFYSQQDELKYGVVVFKVKVLD